MSDYLGWDKVLDGLTQENSPEAVEHSRESLYRFVKDTNDVLSGRCDDIVKNIGKKVSRGVVLRPCTFVSFYIFTLLEYILLYTGNLTENGVRFSGVLWVFYGMDT